jgi:hypothetical protein
MYRRSLALLALTAFVSVAAATDASACCGCSYSCAPPAQVQIWGLSPSYGVNQGPFYTGPGYTTSPTFEGEASTVDYPYVGDEDYRGYRYRPYDGGPYADPLRHRSYRHYWHGMLPERHREMFYRHGFERHDYERRGYERHGFEPRTITLSRADHWMSRSHRSFRDRRDY